MGLQATNAGIDFQQRVSAYMMMLMEFDMDISLALQLNRDDKIEGLNFEACESIDDLVLTLNSGKKVYFQMKRTLSLSDSADSEFYGVCVQFVKQYLKQNDDDILQQKFTTQIKKAKTEGNPFGYSSESYIYANYTQIIEQVGEKEEFIECIECKVVLYNEFVARMYNDCETYYAPIIYLSVDGEPFLLPNNCFPMLTNPFELSKYIKNWGNMGFSMRNYEVCIIKDDNEFILKMISLITNHILPVVDAMFGLDGRMVRGIHMHLMWEMHEEHGRRSEDDK